MDEWEDRQVGELNLDVRYPLAAQILHLIKKLIIIKLFILHNEE